MDSTAAGASLTLTGTALTATATGLFFNFADTNPAFLNFTSDGWPGPFTNDHGLSLEFCGANTSCVNQVSATNMLPGVVGTGDGMTTGVLVGGAELRVPGAVGAPGDRVLLSIRPETLRLVEGGVADHRIVACLTLREFLGPILRLHATLPDGTAIRVAALGGEVVRAAPGDALSLGYDPAQILVYPAP